ncbi:MAG: hypothetical protein AAGL10_08405 [Pseudomonadota bacterium]
MESAVKFFATNLSLVFAFAFLVPVIDQTMQATGIAAPFGLTTLTFALIIGGAWGLLARVTGRWI